MAIKLLLLSALLINHGDGRGGVHTDPGFVEVPNSNIARPLVATGQALYVNRKDDPRKDAADTATPDDVAAVEAQVAHTAARTRERETAAATAGKEKA